jgi:hypothetical protein
MNLHPYLPNVIEFPGELMPRNRITDEELEVFEVVELRSTLMLGGELRKLYVAVHEKNKDGSMITLFVVMEGRQRIWHRTDIDLKNKNPNDY